MGGKMEIVEIIGVTLRYVVVGILGYYFGRWVFKKRKKKEEEK